MRLTCANGSRWTARGCGPCRGCVKEAAELARQFAVDRLLGLYDDDGYSPEDRRAQQRRSEAA